MVSYIDDLMRDLYAKPKLYVTEKYHQASTGLQAQIAETIAELVDVVLQPMILKQITTSYELKDGTKLTAQEAFDRAVREDKDVYAMMLKYRPSNLKYVHQARRYRKYIAWSSDKMADGLTDYLQEHGIVVSYEGRQWLFRSIERFRVQIYK